MTWDIKDKRVLVTGGTSGIGKATATGLARLGARVTVTSRRLADATAAATEIEEATGTTVEAETLDLSSLDSVRELAARYQANHDRLHVLINNAGMMSGRRRTTPDGFEWTLAVNHLGPFLLTNLLTDLLKTSAPARVITVSSENHRSAKNGLDFDDLQMETGYTSSKAYAASKLANIMFTTELDRRLHDHGVTANALHPGVVATSFGKGPEGSKWMGLLMTILKPFLRTPAKGAATTVYLATAQPADLETSTYWSNQKPKQPSDAALDTNASQQLWDRSETLVDTTT